MFPAKTEDTPAPSSIPKNRGAERIPLNSRSSTEANINALIVDKVISLAKENKRIYGIPKRLQDGIALDWVYDKEVKLEDIHSILRKIGLKLETGIRYGTPRFAVHEHEDIRGAQDDELTNVSGPSSSKNTLNHQVRSVSAPVHGQPLVEEFARSATEDAADITYLRTSGKRRMGALYGDESHFTLPNLSFTATPETLRHSLLAADVPAEA
ncbi:hypothetical protein BDY19DRAFT_507414 [Irpex rosettiformis]|uniref:Uncharacterized protein n=1 Tax=Irpex rosettiformis TaxID=378272 RepID=A0ACB8UEK8_9APHY|nr:hypothetical protein BDY19DRAFT_507414 [Irpex rosettiformis]